MTGMLAFKMYYYVSIAIHVCACLATLMLKCNTYIYASIIANIAIKNVIR